MAEPEPQASLTAASVLAELESRRSDEQQSKYLRYFKTGPGEYAEHTTFLGVPMGQVFAVAKDHLELPLADVEVLLDQEIHEAKAAALSVLDKRARRRRTSDDERREMYELYLRRHDRVDNWDLVDLAAPHVVGGYLFERDRSILEQLAASPIVWERRTAIMATLYFARQDDLDDVVRIATLLLDDDHDLIHKPVGGLLREVGKRDRDRLLGFLDDHAAQMPRTMLRYAMEHLEPEVREHYRGR